MQNKTHLFNAITLSILLTMFLCGTVTALNQTTSLRVGTSADYPPFSYLEKGQYTGFDIELMQQIAERLHYRVEIVDMPFKTLLAAIQLGTIDVIAAGLSETPERAKQVLFLPPHLEGSSLVILTKEKIIQGVSDLNGKEVIVNDGYTAAQYMQAFPEIRLQYLKSTSDALAALEVNRAFAFVTSKNALNDFMKHHPKAKEFHTFPLKNTGESTSLAISKRNIKLYEEIKKALSEMQQDGSLQQLKTKMGFNLMNLQLLQDYFPILAKGALVSILIAGLGCLIGLILGMIAVVLLFRKQPLINAMVYLYINLIRGTPMLIQILFLYFVLPGLNIYIPAFWTAVLAIGLNSGAYVSNIIRTGIMAVGKGQYEAAKVIGLSNFQTFRLIIFPQAFRISLPTLGNEFITLVKDSSLASVIGVFELSKQGELMMHKTYDAMSSYTLVAILYLMITLSLSLLVLYVEKKINKHVYY